ncbi:TonB-dependent receptor [Sphingomonas sp. PB2P19]|uniref:TonB-dependent receptor n=1 Tax=Sphingomonas rhamnosi TaxID=3096156 RepID=UPI002FC5F9BE
MMIRFMASSALALLSSLHAAQAQDVGSGTSQRIVDAQTQTSPDEGLADIIVTAQRRSETAQRAGIAIDVVSGSEVTNQGVTQPSDLNRIVPSLNVQDAGGANKTFFLRGVGNFTVNGYSDPAIAVNYDGVYLGRPTSTSGLFYDLERLEVLKGPQGTLYGRNATAGAINILPAKPRLGETSGFVVASYGNYDAIAAQGALNVPLGTNAALRVSGTVTDRSGYLSDGTSDEKTQAGRAQLLVQLTPDLQIRLGGDFAHSGGKGIGSSYEGSYALNRATGAYNFVPSGLDRSVGIFDPAAQAYRQTLFLGVSGRNAAPLDDDIYQNNHFYGFNGEATWDTGAGTLTVIPAYRRASLDYKFAAPSFVGYLREKDEQFSLEARFAGKRIGAFDYILGAFLYDEQIKGNYTFAQQALNTYQTFDSSTKSAALFGRLTANLTDRARLIGGVRYTHDKKDFAGQADVLVVVCTARNAFGVPSCPTVPLLPVTATMDQLPAPFIVPPIGQARPIGNTGAILTRVATPVDTTLGNNEVTWRAAAEFDVSARSLLYASVERGYRSGGFSLAAGYESYAPEFITAYTIGMKNRLFDNKLQLNLEAFWWDYKDQQIGRVGVDANGNQGQFSQNIGQSTIKGAEADIEFLPFRDTLLSANVQYLDTRYDSFVFTQPVGTSPPLTGCGQTLTGNIYTIDCSGFPAFNAPKWTVNLGAQQTVNVGDFKLVGGVDTQYRSSRYVQVEFLPQELVGETWTTNAQIGVGPADDRWQLTAFVRNIEDRRIVLNTPIYGLASALTATTSAPRTYGVRVNAKF